MSRRQAVAWPPISANLGRKHALNAKVDSRRILHFDAWRTRHCSGRPQCESASLDKHDAKPRHLPARLLLRAARLGDRTATPGRRGARPDAAAPVIAGVNDEGQTPTARPALVGFWHVGRLDRLVGHTSRAGRSRRRSVRLLGPDPQVRNGATTGGGPAAVSIRLQGAGPGAVAHAHHPPRAAHVHQHALAGGRTLAEVRVAAGHTNLAVTSIYAYCMEDGAWELFGAGKRQVS